MRNFYACGDSYLVGVGLDYPNMENIAKMLSDSLSMNLLNLALSGCSNYAIYLQVKYALHQCNADFVLISTTSFDRTEWVAEGSKIKPSHKVVNVTDINYMETERGSNIITNHPDYTGGIYSATYLNVLHWVKERDRLPHLKHKFVSEQPEKLQILADYFMDVYDHHIKQSYDLGMLVTCHLLLKKAGIPHMITGTQATLLEGLVDSENLSPYSWQEASNKWPDQMGSSHCSKQGHKDAHRQLLPRINSVLNTKP